MGRHYTLTPSFQALPDYAVTTSSGASVVPGTDDIDNHCHDCETPVTLPFPVRFYDQTFTSANVSSNGFLQFNGNGFDQGGACIPNSSFNNVIAAHWSHLYTSDAASGQGIFTSVSGTAPDRIFNIEWRARYCCVNGPPTENFEIRLYESQNRIDLVYGATALALSDPSGIDFGIGVQRDAGQCQFTALSCGTAPPPGTRYTLTIPSAVTVTGAVSRKTHGGAGTFDIPMPLTGTSGVECRTTGGTNDYTLAVSFSDNVNVTGTPQAQITSGTGCVGSSGTCTGNVSFSGNSITVPLTNVANGQVINIRLNGVNGIDFNIPMGLLVGDANGNRTVNASDVSQTKARVGQAVDATNFRSDVNANGAINAGDVSLVKSRAGTALPASFSRVSPDRIR